MAETTMPATEAELAAAASEDERARYELAFHVLPTVAEGEVTGVVDGLKAHIAKAGGEVFAEEAPERIDLAYEVVEHVEGKNRKFKSAYFGWLRFAVAAEAIERITAEVDGNPDILRYLVIRLTKVEEQRPFYYHQALREQKLVTTVDESKVVPDTTTVTHETARSADSAEEGGEANDQEIEEALKKSDA